MNFFRSTLYPLLAVVIAVTAGLFLLNRIPDYFQAEQLAGNYPDIESAERALGIKIWVPRYFPSFLLWPPQMITVEDAAPPAIYLFFGKKDGGYLSVYQAVHPSPAHGLLKRPQAVTRELAVTINSLPATLVIGEQGGRQITQLYWDDEDRTIRMECNTTPEQLLRMARSMRP